MARYRRDRAGSKSSVWTLLALVSLPLVALLLFLETRIRQVEGQTAAPELAAASLTRALEELYDQINHTEQLLNKHPGIAGDVGKGPPALRANAGASEALEASGGGVAAASPALSGLRDLCTGIAHNLGAPQLVAFVASLRRVSPNADLLLFLNSPIPERHREIIEKFSITALEYEQEGLEPEFLTRYHPSSLRWVLLHRFLEENHAKYGRVVMADVRDTIFQSDPFALVGATGMHVFQEDKSIGSCGWNSGWVKDCFGHAELQRIAAKPILCSGVGLGPIEGVREYVRAMSDKLLSPQMQKCERNGVDQGLHNYIIYSGLLPTVRAFAQAKGLVAHMQSAKYTLGGASGHSLPKVLNQAGKAVAIAHQYDRNQKFAAQVLAEYQYWTEDDSAACEAFAITQGRDLFKGSCDLSFSRVARVEECCSVCSAHPQCKAFTLAGNTCFLKTCATSRTSVAMSDAVSGAKA